MCLTFRFVHFLSYRLVLTYPLYRILFFGRDFLRSLPWRARDTED